MFWNKKNLKKKQEEQVEVGVKNVKDFLGELEENLGDERRLDYEELKPDARKNKELVEEKVVVDDDVVAQNEKKIVREMCEKRFFYVRLKSVDLKPISNDLFFEFEAWASRFGVDFELTTKKEENVVVDQSGDWETKIVDAVHKAFQK